MILKACAEDTRLRILNLLENNELTVKKICQTLNIAQSVISKHLSRLRLLKLVVDRRQGKPVYYRLTNKKDTFQCKIITFLQSQYKKRQTLQIAKKKAKKTRKK